MSIVTIHSRTVGQHFGCVGEVRSTAGELLFETDTLPYNFTANALADARVWTSKQSGIEVLEIGGRVKGPADAAVWRRGKVVEINRHGSAASVLWDQADKPIWVSLAELDLDRPTTPCWSR